ncbi:energy transducer TonB [Chryseobacterium sp. S90]|uniref:energy transducer TonB n=1 Tax=Chryseobacterium sp. S90 TaxID=3395373 RepID=UPI0039BCD6BF
MKKHFSLFLFFALNLYFSQQTEGLRTIKVKYDIQIQNIENSYTDALTKASVRKQAKITLIKDKEINSLKYQRNIEYQKEIEKIQSAFPLSESTLTVLKDNEVTPPKYPDGIDAFRKEIINNFNIEAIRGKGKIQTTVKFIVEKDGSIIVVKGIGENENFNREAATAVLLTQKKWEPAKKDGLPERAHMSIPLTLNFD